MKNVKFIVGCTKTMQFTSNQMEKIQKGIEIFNKVVSSKEFEKKITNYTWTTPTGNTYSRFHISRGMSNKQVWNCLTTGSINWNGKMKANTVWNIMPCTSKMDIVNCNVNPTYATPMGKTTTMNGMNTTPCIWINTNCLTDDNYTPIHVASAIMHEYTINAGGFACHVNGQLVRNWNCTVPYACGQMMMECCKTVCSKDSKVKKFFKNIQTMDYNYCPVSAMFFVEGWETSWNSASSQLDAVICSLEVEMDCLNNISKKTAAEKNRFVVVNNTLETLRDCKVELVECCLDGCETVGTVCTTNQMAYAN